MQIDIPEQLINPRRFTWLKLYIVLMIKADENNEVIVSITDLCKIMERSRPVVCLGLRRLEDSGFITRVSKGGPNINGKTHVVNCWKIVGSN